MADLEFERIVLARIRQCPELEAAEVGVVVRRRIVTLVGHVNSFTEKSVAREAVNQVPGVLGVIDHLERWGEKDPARRDRQLAEEARGVVVADTAADIDMLVEHGWITLRGAAGPLARCVRLDAALRALAGAEGVTYEPGAPARQTATLLPCGLEK